METEQEKVRKSPKGMIILGVTLTLIATYRYVASFGQGLPLSGIFVGIAVAGTAYGVLAHTRFQGLPDFDREGVKVRATAIPSIAIGAVLAGALVTAELLSRR